MPASRQFSRINTLELKSQIENKIGRPKAEMYFSLLTKYLSLKISKPEFNRLCLGTIGKENLDLHNQLIKAILRNASLSTTPPPKVSKDTGSLSIKVANGYQRSSLQSLCRDFPQSPRKGRTPSLRDRKFRDRLSPLGPQGKSGNITFEDSTPKIQEQQSATELFSLGSRPPCSVEDGEEVEQAAGSPGIHSRSPLIAPLGILRNAKKREKLLLKESAPAVYFDTCHNKGELPDTSSLMKRLEQKLEMEGLKISLDCANLLNNSLDVYLKRLIKPSLELAGSRSGNKLINQGHSRAVPGLNGMYPVKYVEKPTRPGSASMLDFRVAMEMNPPILGEDWPMKLEKFCLHASEDRTEI
ncbi:Transcriptional coactivator [Parasponia andersonii]|uniref:Transcriptional coactivator n=1 Tax=Parasponia andersonii TaxID=3476 RepID=A0A2P5D0A8_PARAD|nr:Transcriptional coactivator [Parasponia andersonii]